MTMKKTIATLLTLLSCLTGMAQDKWMGDVNEDGNLTVADVAMMIDCLNGTKSVPEATKGLYDVDKDGEFTIADLRLLIRMILGTESKRRYLGANTDEIGTGEPTNRFS